MDMRFNTTDRVKKYVLLGNNSILDERPEVRFQSGRDHRMIVLGVPRDMKIDLGVRAIRHCW